MSFRVCVVAFVACGGRAPTAVPIPLTEAAATLTTQPVLRDDLSAPFALTASDGSGLAVTRLEAKAVIEGPLAFTELHLYFRNPEPRVREGTFQITLPPRAAISRFAMELEGQLVEAEVVPKLIARRAYDDFLHRKQDPALLERAAGNQFTAKVFPIAGGADKHLVISYSQPLPGIRYALPLRGLPTIERVDVELAALSADGTRHLDSLHQRAWQPDRDFESTVRGTPVAIGSAGTVAAQLEIAATTGRDVPKALTILVDTSASRALGYERYLANVQRMIASLAASWGRALPITVIAFDQDSELIYTGAASGFTDAHRDLLVARGAAGASDLGQALASLPRPARRLLIVGDGVITAGAEGRELHAIAQRLDVERIDVALTGGLRDDRAATLVASAKRRGAVLDLVTDPVAAALGETVADVPIDVPGASWVYPRRIANARSGTRVMVYARGIATPTIDVIAGTTRARLPVLPVARPLVDRAVAGAELAELEERLVANPGDLALRAAIASMSVAARVLSSETSMLVLETDGDYTRYGLDRRALGEVLVIGPHGLETRSRAPGKLPGASAQPMQVATRDPLGSIGSARPTRPALADTDHDAIVDVDDRCPSEAETVNGTDDDDGCPDRGRVIVTNASIQILEPVYFESDQAVIRPQASPVLDAVAATMIANQDIALLEVGGHTDRRGDRAQNLDLSERRARAVRDYLIAKGVEPDRLIAQGYGGSQPRVAGNSTDAWARNRRVDFLILRRAGGPTQPPSPPPPPPPAVTGELGEIQQRLAAHDPTALSRARAWHAREPGNVLALVALGEVLEATHAPGAARIYGSIIDLFPGRADLRRFAGERLARLPAASLAIDTFRRAVADRPDHLTGHRLLAYAYVRADRLADAFTAILAGLDHEYREASYAGGRRVLSEDAGLIGAVYATREPAKRAAIVEALASRKLALATSPSTRFVLHWETDANDVDLHVRDARGNHAFFRAPKLATGGELYADVTTGYGPECFAITGKPTAGPYQISAHYYAQGPMGYGMGLLEVVRFDGKVLAFEHKPFVITANNATIDLGTY
jgi:outer membrane protein OmpA-like peptidoglycan-associated protein